MSPQFVDFDADGRLDIVAGTFDGSPRLVRGTDKGWGQLEQILDREGNRIVLNRFWNLDTKTWDTTKRHDAKGHEGEGHLTSAIAFDLDGDGDLDLLLGDYCGGGIYVRRNEGTRQKPAFATTNERLLADGKPIDVAGTVATLRPVDWNRDGRMDLACSSMGDPYTGAGDGGGVVVYLDTGEHAAAEFGAPITLLERSKKGAVEPTRPDSAIYMDFGDHDGDGDLDMIVGGYSFLTPKPVALTDAQQRRAAELEAAIAALELKLDALSKSIEDAVKDLDEQAAEKKREQLFEAKSAEFRALGKQQQALQDELEPLAPGTKRESYVWLYENRAAEAAAGRK
ncbi:MAG: VCBS repeat-containing protein [Planctomycetes bacterium]|nr:VCBS repeat-containing protein [Planctomycetota bacterium]